MYARIVIPHKITNFILTRTNNQNIIKLHCEIISFYKIRKKYSVTQLRNLY